jgi:hypothetical protein
MYRLRRLPASSPALAAIVAVLAAQTAAAQGLTCDLSGYAPNGPHSSVQVSGEVLTVEWAGTGAERVRLRLAIREGTPVIDELALRAANASSWVGVGTNLGFEFRIVEGLRRISNQQLEPLRDLGVELELGRTISQGRATLLSNSSSGSDVGQASTGTEVTTGLL